jgi:hypothetical protein
MCFQHNTCPLKARFQQFAALSNLAAQQQDVAAACRYYAVVVDKAGKHEPQYQEARAYLRRHGSARKLL